MSDLAVTAIGAATPVGLSAPAACAAIRAGVSRVALREEYLCIAAERGGDEEPDPVRAALAPGLPSEWDGRDRLVRLAAAALQSLARDGALSRADVPRTALVVALPASGPGTASWGLGEKIADEIQARCGLGRWAGIAWSTSGPVGVFRALEAAQAQVDGDRAARTVVLAADTFVDVDRLAAFDASWRIRSARNPDGFLPGEAGVALVLEHRREAERRRAPVLGLVGPASFAVEPQPVGGERWSTGLGLANAVRPLLAGSAGAVGRWVLCNMNGESYGAHEWGIARMRLASELPVVEALVHPAESVGEAGTALGALLVACACHAFTRRHAPAPAALAWVASDDGARGALVLRPSGGAR